MVIVKSMKHQRFGTLVTESLILNWKMCRVPSVLIHSKTYSTRLLLHITPSLSQRNIILKIQRSVLLMFHKLVVHLTLPMVVVVMVTILNRLRRLVVNMMAMILSPTMIHIRSTLLVITRLMNGIIA